MTGALVYWVEAQDGNRCSMCEVPRCLLKVGCLSNGVSQQRGWVVGTMGKRCEALHKTAGVFAL